MQVAISFFRECNFKLILSNQINYFCVSVNRKNDEKNIRIQRRMMLAQIVKVKLKQIISVFLFLSKMERFDEEIIL